MPRGLFLQGMAVLFRALPSVDEVTAALQSLGDVGRRPASGEKNWISGYEGWLVPFRPEVNGKVIVELIDAPWPDGMGNPTAAAPDKFLFGAWSMGFMTPGAWPGMLEIAKFTADALGDKDAAQAAGPRGHVGFARVLLSYALGADDKAPVAPASRDARVEFEFCLKVVEALLTLPGALAYFNPAGSLLMSPARYQTSKGQIPDGLPPLPLATMPRKAQLSPREPTFMEITGLSQLRDHIPDVSALLGPPNKGGEVVDMLYNIATYLISSGPVIADGHTIDGPGGRWRAKLVKESETPPPREVLTFSPDAAGKRGFFSRLFRR
jgi:hypothetical protein